MNNFNRRDFIKLMGISAASVAIPSLVKAATGGVAPRVAVVGSGFAGSTVAKYLRIWSGNMIDVTVIDPKAAHVSCVMSNLVVNGKLNMSDITFHHSVLSQKYGVSFEKGEVVDIRSGLDGKTVSYLQDGKVIDDKFDFVVLAPGIAMNDIPGWDQNIAPHAWIAGEQTELLKSQMERLEAGDTVVMTVPKAPYRCPPGPYERACVFADMVKRKGGGRVVVLDMNPKIIVEEHMFSTAFSDLYGGIVEYYPNVQIHGVNGLTIDTSEGSFSGKVLNVIPTHKAGKIVQQLGYATVSNSWADIDPISYELQDERGVFVIGDSGGTSQPKSGHMANSQAKVCTDAIIRMIANEAVDSPERLANITTNSACYSPISNNTATWLTAGFAYDVNEKKMKPVKASLGQAEQHSMNHYQDMFTWSRNLFENTFM